MLWPKLNLKLAEYLIGIRMTKVKKTDDDRISATICIKILSQQIKSKQMSKSIEMLLLQILGHDC